jgi:hypothetical protein
MSAANALAAANALGVTRLFRLYSASENDSWLIDSSKGSISAIIPFSRLNQSLLNYRFRSF